MDRDWTAKLFSDMPLVAILRGMKPDEALDIGQCLYEEGFRFIEVPLNSPRPLESIAILSKALGDKCMIGAGTVLTLDQVETVYQAGGRLTVSPDCKPPIIARSLSLGMLPMPGVATASETFRAIDAGAQYLKLFPASTYGPSHVNALRAVMPKDVKLLAVGGVGAAEIPTWKRAGCAGFGIGGELYKPGRDIKQIRQAAHTLVQAWKDAA